MNHNCLVLSCVLLMCVDNLHAQDSYVVNSLHTRLIIECARERFPSVYNVNNNLIDSLEVALSKKVGKDRLNCLVDFAIKLIDHNNEKALLVMRRAEMLAMEVGDSLSIAQCLRIKGQVLSRLHRLDEAMNMFQLSLAISERHKFDYERMRALVPYGVDCIKRSQYDKGLRAFTAAQELAVALKDTTSMEAALNNLGVVYYKLKDYAKALHYWKTSAASQELRNAPSFSAHVNMSLAYANLDDFSNANRALDYGIAICGVDCSEEALIHINYASGFIFLCLKDYKNAEAQLIKSYQLAKRTQNLRMLLDNIYLLADVYQKQQKTDLALSYLKEGEVIINRGMEFNLEIVKIYRRFADVYLTLQNFRKAALYQSRYIQHKDSIFNEDLTTSLMKAEANYLERYNKAKIASQKELIVLKEEIIARQGKVNVLAILLTLVTVACFIFLYRHYRFKQLMNDLLEERIRERTFELERSRNELLIMLRERDAMIERAERETVGIMNTIDGLCRTAKAEDNHLATYSYLEMIERTSCRLRKHLGVLLGSGRATSN